MLLSDLIFSLISSTENIATPEVAIPEKLQELATNTGYEGVKTDVKLTDPKLASLATEVADLLRQHPEIVGDKTGKSLNEFLRGLEFTRKDFDAMGVDDFKPLRS